ncbi:ATP-binding cassette domain-containing protein [Granulicatella sp. zg-ZJ]|uniref:ABC transporter ATP-binding protein n=1 Tax=Granulicatella sp. zg-ZJ TaxID=2678504 RepID=UPI0013D00ACC|nr:ABC transporter ATP-binding protein [Granulicatella sp. zg-ZJ]MBS4751090.1 ABC transporter ATP-binding protein [Carnobacteriaceae bacterium zg-ZUI78]NEW62911.1 ATP-binding cassette domain-containing protein [Granulicatella sp. zg-ZJ]
MAYAIELRNITKQFPGVLANDNITLKVEENTVHSILGENGSGKSTLMNVLFGLHKADQGEIYINGQKAVIHNPEDAYRYGVGMVHQHFMLVEQMTALENIILGKEVGNFFIDKEQSYKEVSALVEKYGFQLDLNEKVANLSIGMKQRVEILKTLYRGADTVILDEPSAVLTPQEVLELFDMIRSLKEKGKTIIFITHKLNEIMEVADTITVIRRGKVITSIDKNSTNTEKLANAMVGRDVTIIQSVEQEIQGDVVLEVNALPLLSHTNKTVSFSIRAGEIFGVAGVEGNGQLQLEESIVGLIKSSENQVMFHQQDIGQLNPASRKKLGIGYIPSDRFKRAILPDFSVLENILLGFQDSEPFVKNGVIQEKELYKYSNELIEKFDIRLPNASVPIKTLSGGNQQKVVVARETSRHPKLVVACQPTRGLDVGAIEFIHETLLKLRDEGKAILLISAELTEVMNLSDRIGVMFEGEFQDILTRDAFDQEHIGNLMAGNKKVGESS